MTHTTGAIYKAARPFILAALDQAGLLAGLTSRELGQLLGCDMTTAHCARRDLRTAQAMTPSILAQAQELLNVMQEANR